MNLNDLKQKTYNSSYPLDDLLLEFREIAKKKENKLFLNWINNELNGYNKEDTPHYRIIENYMLTGKISNGYNFQGVCIFSIQLIKIKKENEKKFIDDIKNVKINFSLSEIQEQSLKNEAIKLMPEQAFSYLLDKQIIGAQVQSFFISVQVGQYKKILNNIRMLLQDFIEELEKINNWEENDLTSTLMNKTFIGNITIHQTTHNVTNTMGNGNGNIINSGNENKLSIINNNSDVVTECFKIVNGIKENDKDIEKIKSEIITSLQECEKEQLNNKQKILEKISTVILTSAAATADLVTIMPLFTPLLTYLKG